MTNPARTAQVRLEPWTAADLDLLRRFNAPEMRAHLGGSEPDEQVQARQERYLEAVRSGAYQPLRIVLPGAGEVAGGIVFWERTWADHGIYEIGWSVLPEFQGRGIAAAATAAAVRLAAAEGRQRYLHAFPAVDNAASNGVCRKVGFTLRGGCEVEYPPGHPMRCNDWRLDLAALDR
ncbi:MAG TPA: GNAT family N-acetyltransferase [Rugosimonospora sp.]|nr:GNAT family N-acetyltransferase [Rugosimonospora sp.]